MSRSSDVRVLRLIGALHKLSGLAFKFQEEVTFDIEETATLEELQDVCETRLTQLAREYGHEARLNVQSVFNAGTRHANKMQIVWKERSPRTSWMEIALE